MRETPQVRPFRSDAPGELGFGAVLDVADRRESEHGEAPLRHGADAPDGADRPRPQKIARLLAPDHREAARLVAIRGELRQELAVAQPDRNRDAVPLLHLRHETGQRQRRRAAVHGGRPGKVEEGLVDRDGLHQRRQIAHHGAYRPPDARVFGHVRAHDRGLRAELQGLEHRHRRAHAVGPGDVAGGQHHAARAAADNQWFVAQTGVVALLDTGVESVAVNMRNRQRADLAMREDAWRPAFGAARGRRCRQLGEALATEPCGHQPSPLSAAASRWRIASIAAGSRLRSAAKASSSLSSAQR